MIWTLDPQRWLLAGALTSSYALVCLLPYLRARRVRHARAARAASAGDAAPWIVAYASQTGQAEQLAHQTADTLHLAGVPVRLVELSELTPQDWQTAGRMLLLVSTYGEGDAPDAAAGFARRVLGAAMPQLSQLHYGLLALGDASYREFCGFGRTLDQWLQAQGAQALFPRIEVDRAAPAAIAAWRQQLSHLAGTSDAPDWEAPAFQDWRLVGRQLLNPGSAGGALYQVELLPQSAPLPVWQSGDLVQVAAPSDPDRAREYSIASIPAEGRVQLLVRLQQHADGTLGAASGWLTQQAPVGSLISLRWRPHRRFRLEDNAQRPLILIGNGSGIAGLRAHLKARALAGQRRNWLLFGERHAAHDYHYREELAAWQQAGLLPRLDLAFSRDQPQRIYVQDRVRGNADELREWVEQGAALYVCGSLEGMAAGVDRALEDVLGRAVLDQLAAQGRYRRDVY
ncbi:MAG: sulfite reductase subunit alpha [Sphingomonadaceae bacterium]